MDSASIVESTVTNEPSPICPKSILKFTGFTGRTKIKRSLTGKVKNNRRVTFTDSMTCIPFNQSIKNDEIDSPRGGRSCACLIV